MKKITAILLVLVLTLSLAACGRRNNKNDQQTTPATTDNSILPTMDPTTATNVPDPTVNSNSTMNTESTDGMDLIPGDNGNTTDPSASSNSGNGK